MMGAKREYSGTEATFALYRGDEFIDIGTAAELAEKMGVKPSTIAFYATPSNIRRANDAGYGNRLIAVKIE